MALYSRTISHESRAADYIQALLLSYPPERQAQGITVKELLRDYPNQLKSDISVLAALDLLTEERKVVREKSTGHAHPYDSIRIYPQTYKEGYKSWTIEVLVRSLEDETFNAYGYFRKPHSAFTGLPFECSFDTQGEKHPTPLAALRAGIDFAKKKIDSE